MVPLGFYFIHRTTLNCSEVPLDAFRERQTLTVYPQFLRYEVFKHEENYFALNARGTLIVLQLLKDITSVEQASKAYDTPEIFDPLYREAILLAKDKFGYHAPDFDDSSLAWFGATQTNISWRVTELAVDERSKWRICIFLEALFIFSACKAAETVLVKQLERPSNLATTNFIVASKDLILMEDPSDFLVNQDEILLLALFYKEWEVTKKIKNLQAKFSQVLAVLTLHASKVQGDNAMALNLLVGCATVLALLSVADPLQDLVGNLITAEALKVGTLVISAGLGTAAFLRGRLPWVRERASRYIFRRSIKRKLAAQKPCTDS